ncbi:MAG TPA: hypothetical protein VFL31_01965 [Nitrospiraceae bacterium]|nr:hypothetical protein [Nitrospiraceae bacterium]
MPKLIYTIDCSGLPLEIAAQALTVLQVQEYARRKGFTTEQRHSKCRRQYLLVIPLDELNTVLDELLLAGLLNPRRRSEAGLPRISACTNVSQR